MSGIVCGAPHTAESERDRISQRIRETSSAERTRKVHGRAATTLTLFTGTETRLGGARFAITHHHSAKHC
jgi:hypothetical protein